MTPLRVLLIGWDGAEPALVEPWLAQGKLPALAGLVARGTLGRVRSTVPPVTPPAWTSLMTGVDPGRHGIYSFTRPSLTDYTEELVSATERQAPSIWHYLSATGRRVGIFNLSLTYPPEPVNGFLFAGFDAPVFSPRLAYPPEAFAAATAGLSGYVHEGLDRYRGEVALVALLRQMRQQRDLLSNLIRAYPVEVLAANFNTPDHIHHHAWPLGWTAEQLAASSGSEVEQAYRALDGVLGELLAAYTDESTQIVLVSDHGGGRMIGQVSLNRALEEGGFLVRAPRRGSVRTALRRALPPRIKTRLWGLAGERLRADLAQRLRADLAQRLRADHIAGVDWSRTTAFAWGSQGDVQVNLRGREAQGCVAPEDRERVLAEVAAFLRTLQDPSTGAPVIGEIRRAEEIFREPRVGYPPDLLVEGAGGEWGVMPWWERGGEHQPGSVHRFAAGPDAPLHITANHRPWGVLATCGPAVRAGTPVPELGLADLAPALLYLADAPIPEGLDGRLERRLWDTGREPIKGQGSRVEGQGSAEASQFPAPAYSAAEQAEVEQRLADLGYM
jgi:predicted AlkP superfamily phosphohydrolase/phosphomutase